MVWGVDLYRRIIFNLLAYCLIILSHFANYLIYIEYSFDSIEVIIVLGFVVLFSTLLAVVAQLGGAVLRAIIFAILISLVLGDAIFELGVDEGRTGLFAASLTLIVSVALALLLGRHAGKVLAGAFGIVLCATLVLPYFRPLQSMPGDGHGLERGQSNLPVILHLVLDEHVGLIGLDASRPGGERLAHDLRQFYVSHGFRVFSHAYSQFFDTPMALASTLNFDSGGSAEAYLKQGRGTWSLLANRYFSELGKRGYNARIYHSTYMNFCRSDGIALEACEGYNLDKFVPESIAELPLKERLYLIVNMYYSSIAVIRLMKLLSTALENYGVELPSLGLWQGSVGPIAVLPTLDKLADDLSRASGGTVFFAHLLIPHYPYVFQSNCNIRKPVSSWQTRFHRDGTIDPESRRRRYAAYYDQIRCTLRRLTVLFDAMKAAGSYDDAIIIIHGDHGSRIVQVEPTAENISQLTSEDHRDSFSTLFAAKMPGLAAGTDATVAPISVILPYLLGDFSGPLFSFPNTEAYFASKSGAYVKSPIILTDRD